MNVYMINGHDVREVKVANDFKIYDTYYFEIESIDNGILRVKNKYEKLEFNIKSDGIVKSSYDIMYDENKFKKPDVEEIDGRRVNYDRLTVLLSENYLYDMFE